jgi:hypothetical protein
MTAIRDITMDDVDMDDLEIALLEENIRTTNEISNDISSQLLNLSRLNKNAVYSIAPLMSKIQELKKRRDNLQLIENKVSDVKVYALRIRNLLNDLDSDILNNNSGIDKYINALDQLDEINDELNNVGLSGFEGLKESLGEGVLDGELALKAELLKRVKIKNNNDSELLLLHKIYVYLSEVRQMSLEDAIIRERGVMIKRLLVNIHPDRPVVNKDQNYIYDGVLPNSRGFMQFSQELIGAALSESEFARAIFGSNFDGRIITKFLRPITDSYIYELKSLMEFVDSRLNNYGTLYYELSKGSNEFIQWLIKHGSSPSDTLNQLSQQCLKCAQETFKNFFNYMKERYNEMIIPSSHDTLNTTFMLLATRINKLTAFRQLQLEIINQLELHSWLPKVLPPGFQPDRAVSHDAQYLLGSFYSDVLEYALYALSEKYTLAGLSEEDVGVMLLFNLDGIQNLLEGQSTLRQIIGQKGLERWEKLKKKAMDKAVLPWSQLAAKVMVAATQQGGQLSMGSKEIGKFADEFNGTFDNLCGRLRAKSVPPFYRSQLVNDVVKTLVPTYKVFYQYATATGNGSGGKKLKYNPRELQDKLGMLS